MSNSQTFAEMKNLFQAGLEGNKDSLTLFGATYWTQLKAYLIESNLQVKDLPNAPNQSIWKSLDAAHWYVNSGGNPRVPCSLIHQEKGFGSSIAYLKQKNLMM